MKELFPGYYAPSEPDLQSLWSGATFVLDSSVLLQFYRLPEQTRKQAFKILSGLKGRVWIPHNVALEYHRGRVRCIIEARDVVAKSVEPINRAFEEVYRAVAAVKLADRGLVDAVERMSEIRKAGEAVVLAAESALAGHIDPNGVDPVADQIAEIFAGAIGTAPSQDQIKSMEAEAAARYLVKMGPGFKDDGKDSFRFGALTYNRKYSDYLVWAQTIEHVARSGIKDLIIITNDAKDDWWLSHNKTVWGPLQEMYAEMLERAKVERFWMYSFEKFLESAGERLRVDVSTTTLSDVASSAHDSSWMSIGDVIRKSAKNLGFPSATEPSLSSGSIDSDRLNRTLTSRHYQVLDSNGRFAVGLRVGEKARFTGALAVNAEDLLILGGGGIAPALARLMSIHPVFDLEVYVYLPGRFKATDVQSIISLVDAGQSADSYFFKTVDLYVGNDDGVGWTRWSIA
jgi:hypothetical protein